MYSIDFRFVSKLLDIKKFLTKVINMKKILITTSTFGLKEAKGSHILEQNGYQVILITIATFSFWLYTLVVLRGGLILFLSLLLVWLFIRNIDSLKATVTKK